MKITIGKVELGRGDANKDVGRLIAAFVAVALVSGIAPKFGELIFEKHIKPLFEVQPRTTESHRIPAATFAERWWPHATPEGWPNEMVATVVPLAASASSSCATPLCNAHGSRAMIAQPQDLMTAPVNLWRCSDCKRLRACPWTPMHTLFSGAYVTCSCGDAANDESGAETAARAAELRFIIANNLF